MARAEECGLEQPMRRRTRESILDCGAGVGAF
jgi:hypothetical protein